MEKYYIYSKLFRVIKMETQAFTEKHVTTKDQLLEVNKERYKIDIYLKVFF